MYVSHLRCLHSQVCVLTAANVSSSDSDKHSVNANDLRHPHTYPFRVEDDSTATLTSQTRRQTYLCHLQPHSSAVAGHECLLLAVTACAWTDWLLPCILQSLNHCCGMDTAYQPKPVTAWQVRPG